MMDTCKANLPTIGRIRRGDILGPGFIVQLVRTPPCHGGGQGFKSPWSRKQQSDENAGAWQNETPCLDGVRIAQGWD